MEAPSASPPLLTEVEPSTSPPPPPLSSVPAELTHLLHLQQETGLKHFQEISPTLVLEVYKEDDNNNNSKGYGEDVEDDLAAPKRRSRRSSAKHNSNNRRRYTNPYLELEPFQDYSGSRDNPAVVVVVESAAAADQSKICETENLKIGEKESLQIREAKVDQSENNDSVQESIVIEQPVQQEGEVVREDCTTATSSNSTIHQVESQTCSTPGSSPPVTDSSPSEPPPLEDDPSSSVSQFDPSRTTTTTNPRLQLAPAEDDLSTVSPDCSRADPFSNTTQLQLAQYPEQSEDSTVLGYSRNSASKQFKPSPVPRNFQRSESLLNFSPTVQRSASFNEPSPRAAPRRSSLRSARLNSGSGSGGTTGGRIDGQTEEKRSFAPPIATVQLTRRQFAQSSPKLYQKDTRPDRSIFPHFENIKGVLFGVEARSPNRLPDQTPSLSKKGVIIHSERRRKSRTPVKDEFTEFSQYGSRYTLHQTEEKEKKEKNQLTEREKEKEKLKEGESKTGREAVRYKDKRHLSDGVKPGSIQIVHQGGQIGGQHGGQQSGQLDGNQGGHYGGQYRAKQGGQYAAAQQSGQHVSQHDQHVQHDSQQLGGQNGGQYPGQHVGQYGGQHEGQLASQYGGHGGQNEAAHDSYQGAQYGGDHGVHQHQQHQVQHGVHQQHQAQHGGHQQQQHQVQHGVHQQQQHQVQHGVHQHPQHQVQHGGNYYLEDSSSTTGASSFDLSGGGGRRGHQAEDASRSAQHNRAKQSSIKDKFVKLSMTEKIKMSARNGMTEKLKISEKLNFLQKSSNSRPSEQPAVGQQQQQQQLQSGSGGQKLQKGHHHHPHHAQAGGQRSKVAKNPLSVNTGLTGAVNKSDSDSGYGDFVASTENRIKQIDVDSEYDLIQQIGEGWISKLYLAENRVNRGEVVLKAINSNLVTPEEFYREYQNSVYLSSHRNILKVYEPCFQSDGFYLYSTEYAPLGDLTSNVSESGLGEHYTKRVATQISAALQFIHSKKLCHLNVKLDNILVFRSDFSLVKLCDFGSVRPFDDIVIKKNEHLPYCPAELVARHTNEYYQVDRVQDVFQFGIVVFFCLLGILPWQKADLTDPNFNEFSVWRRKKSNKIPRNFKSMTAKAQKLFRKLLDPDPDRRLQLSEMHKYLEDRWIRKGGKPSAEVRGVPGDHQSQLTLGSFQSVHSNAMEKNRILYTLLQHGVETTVDRSQKTNRIISWIKQGAERGENISPACQNFPDEYIPEDQYNQETKEDELDGLAEAEDIIATSQAYNNH